MSMMKKGTTSGGRLRGLLAALAAICLILVGSAITAEAAAVSGEVDSKGILTIKNASGTAVKRFSAGDGAHFTSKTAAYGNMLYFASYEPKGGNSDESICRIYIYDVSTDKATSMTLPGGYFAYDVDLAYGGSVYLTGWNPSDNAVGYRLYPESKQMEKIAEGGVRARYKHYLVCDSTRVHGSFVPYTAYVYNAKTKKTTAALKKLGGYTVKGRYLYGAVLRKTTYDPGKGAKYRIIRYDLATGKKKTLVSSMKGYCVDRITSKYVYSRRYTSGRTTFWRYSISKKKAVRMSEAKYKKAAKVQY